VADQIAGNRFTRRWWFGTGLPIAVGYPGSVAVLAAAGVISSRSWPILLAVLLTLPLGFVALAGSYLGYAVLKGVGGLFADTASTAGDQAGWLTFLTGLLIVALVLAAAVGNLILLSLMVATHRRSRRNWAGGGDQGEKR
jgi:hypothetical protein